MVWRTSGLILVLAAAGLPSAASAIVIRHDVPDARYRVPDDFYLPLADLPVEGHGVLIAPRWVVTAGHAVSWQDSPIEEVTINGRPRKVVRVVVHPGFHLPPIPDRGSTAPLIAAFLKLKDVALIELAEPVTDVAPAILHRGRSERGRIAEIIGKGATGDGLTGQAEDAPHRTTLRRAFNRITSADGPWLTYRFDSGKDALPLEGMIGNGDSGGPVLIEDHGVWKLAAVASWKRWDGDIETMRSGVYGQITYQARLSYYWEWIRATMRGGD